MFSWQNEFSFKTFQIDFWTCQHGHWGKPHFNTVSIPSRLLLYPLHPFHLQLPGISKKRYTLPNKQLRLRIGDVKIHWFPSKMKEIPLFLGGKPHHSCVTFFVVETSIMQGFVLCWLNGGSFPDFSPFFRAEIAPDSVLHIWLGHTKIFCIATPMTWRKPVHLVQVVTFSLRKQVINILGYRTSILRCVSLCLLMLFQKYLHHTDLHITNKSSHLITLSNNCGCLNATVPTRIPFFRLPHGREASGK